MTNVFLIYNVHCVYQTAISDNFDKGYTPPYSAWHWPPLAVQEMPLNIGSAKVAGSRSPIDGSWPLGQRVMCPFFFGDSW